MNEEVGTDIRRNDAAIAEEILLVARDDEIDSVPFRSVRDEGVFEVIHVAFVRSFAIGW